MKRIKQIVITYLVMLLGLSCWAQDADSNPVTIKLKAFLV